MFFGLYNLKTGKKNKTEIYIFVYVGTLKLLLDSASQRMLLLNVHLHKCFQRYEAETSITSHSDVLFRTILHPIEM